MIKFEGISISKFETPLFQDVRWAMKAISRDSARVVLQHLHIEKAPDSKTRVLIVATDGKRLHMVHLDNYPDSGLIGDWMLIKKSKREMFFRRGDLSTPYPAFMQIFPKEGSYKTTPYPGSPYYMALLGKMDITLNIKHAEEATADTPINEILTIDPTSPVTFRGDRHTAILMPMRKSQPTEL